MLAAFGAGLVSFLSPCVLPLVPGYLSAVTGVNPSELADAGWRRVLVPSLLFVASFSAIFILLGLSATAIGETLRDHRDTLEKIPGVLIIVMGVLFVAARSSAELNREWHVDGADGAGRPRRPGRRRRRLRDRLDAVHRADAGGDPRGRGDHRVGRRGRLPARRLLAGLAIPFLLTALAFSRMTTAFDAVKRHYGAIVVVGGVILIAMGVLILTGEFFQLNIEAQKLTRELGIDFVDALVPGSVQFGLGVSDRAPARRSRFGADRLDLLELLA